MKFKHLIIMTFLMLVFQYNVYFWFLFTHSRKFFFLWGAYLFVTKIKELHFAFPIQFKRKISFYSILLFSLTAISFLHAGLEPFALKILLSFLVNIFAALPILYLLRKWSFDKSRITVFRNALLILLLAIAVNNTIAVFKLIFPSLYDILMSIQVTDASAGENITSWDAYRLGGWGDNLLFNGGATSALGIIVAMYMCCNAETNKAKLFYLALMLFVLFSGVLIARTTIVGLPLAGLVLLHYIKGVKSIIKYIFAVCAFVGCVIGVFFLVVDRIDERMAAWAFEMVINLFDSGEVESASTNELIEMWNVLPANLSTWLVGDGRMEDQGGYYMGTDVGLLRIIFCIGVIGLYAIMALFRFFSYNKTMPNEIKIFERVFYIWFVIMNVKGIFLPIHLACLLFVFNNTCFLENKQEYKASLSKSGDDHSYNLK